MDRRSFLVGGLVTGGTVLGFDRLLERSRLGDPALARMPGVGTGGYGTLKPVASRNTGETILALPEGFQYTVFGKALTKMSDGHQTPGFHDGMAAFSVRGDVRLVRNHELRALRLTSIGPPELSYDPVAPGGTVTIEVDPKTRELKRDWASLSGTIWNCAGGKTPWGSWISCEEIVIGTKPAVDKDNKPVPVFDKDHGYCFEVSALADTLLKPEPIRAMGRFVHEAVAIDSGSGIVYETEDRNPGGFYRFIPNVPGKLLEGGKLQMLAVENMPRFDTRKGQEMGKTMTAVWVDIDDPDPAEADKNQDAVFQQGLAKGGAMFSRLEGCHFGEGKVFVTATNGGDAELGQVWSYRPRGDRWGELKLIFESPNEATLDAPDNVCLSPRGGLVLCEDGKNQQFMRGLTQDGAIFDFAENRFSQGEFAGACFSPDGETLFVNIQTPGMTLAIWGPWERGAL